MDRRQLAAAANMGGPRGRSRNLWYRGLAIADLRAKECRDGHPARTALRHARARVRRSRRQSSIRRRSSSAPSPTRAGFDTVFLAEHHGADDGYCPSPMVLASAILGRTKRMTVHFSALHRRAAQSAAAGRGPRGARPHQRRSHRDDPGHRLPPPRVRDVRRRRSRSGSRFSRRPSACSSKAWTRRAVRVPGHDGADPADTRAEAAAADLHRWVDRGVGDPGGPLRRRLHAGHAAAVRGVRRGVPAPRQAGAAAVRGRRVRCSCSSRTIPSAAGTIVGPHVMYTSNSNAEWAKERGVGATPYPPITDGRRAEGEPAVRRRHPGGLRRARQRRSAPTRRSRCTR